MNTVKGSIGTLSSSERIEFCVCMYVLVNIDIGTHSVYSELSVSL